jgi:tRNA modification GTPase
MDTIYALASAQGKAGVAIIRVSGPGALAAGLALAGGLPSPGRHGVRRLRDLQDGFLDEALVLRFDGPASFTGEDVVELHLHGSTAVIAAVLRALGAQEGLRMAEPGEFTRRAMENGRLDLAQVEGLADLIDAETEAQRRQAQRLLTGALGDLAERWRTDLIRAAALIEATIDFADEEVPVDVTSEVTGLLDRVRVDLERQSSGVRIAERIRSGFEVAIIGAPNVGKSTLLNYLAGRDAAITSEIAGTTRDVIEVRMDLDGLSVTLLDTAGLRETDDVVETIGIDRARQRAEQADLRVVLSEDGTSPIPLRLGDIVLQPKADQLGPGEGAVSGRTGQGVQQLIARISAELRERSQSAGLATRQRHKEAMQRALVALIEGQAQLSQGPDRYDIAAEDLRTAIRALESLVGRIDVENLLDEIFASFCLGK